MYCMGPINLNVSATGAGTFLTSDFDAGEVVSFFEDSVCNFVSVVAVITLAGTTILKFFDSLETT